MFFILSKILQYILMPYLWIFIMFFGALFLKKGKHQKKLLSVGIILLFFFGNEFIAREAMALWEKEPVNISALSDYETGIVLTGVTKQKSAYQDRTFFDKGADRLLHAVQLYKAGKISKILVTGGSGSITKRVATEAADLKRAFLYCGVNASDLIIEDKSRNTRENAFFTKVTIQKNRLSGKFLLITSAFHMRRAKGCFDKAGVKTDIFPVDYYTGDRKFTPDTLIIPSADGLSLWTRLIHEVFGYIVYKLISYC